MYELLDKINTEDNEELKEKLEEAESALLSTKYKKKQLEVKVSRFKRFNHMVSREIFSFEANGIGNGMRTKLRDIFNSNYHNDSLTLTTEYDMDMKRYENAETGESYEWHLYPRMAVGIKPVKKKVKK